jgi:uncharacterized membrane protein (DUF106 family)
MIWLIRMLHGILNIILTPLNGLSYEWGIAISSAVTGIVMLLIFRWTSNQERIRRVKDIIKAHILEIRLYKDSPRIIMRALGRILLKNGLYLRYALVPLLIMIVPVFLILIQLHFRYEYRSIRAGESVLVKAFVKPSAGVNIADVRLEPPDGISVVTGPLHIPQFHEVDWRIKVQNEGHYLLNFRYGDIRVTKELVAVQDMHSIAPKTVAADVNSVFFNPIEKPLPVNSAFFCLQIIYPRRINKFLGIEVNWLVVFFVLSLVFALVLKGPLKVEI